MSRSLLLPAVQQLTRLPVGGPPPRDRDAAASTAWFAPVGAVVGGVAAFTWWVAGLALPPSAAATCSVAATIALTGARHEAGLASTADGIFGAPDPRGRLAAMRHRALGSQGVLALVLAVLLRVGVLAALDPAQGAAALVVAGAAGRGLLGLAVLGTVPAAPDGGAGMVDHLRPAVAVASAVAVAGVGLGLAGAAGVTAAAAALLVGLGVRALAVGRLGGVTGHVLGAVVALADLTALAVLAGLVTG